MSRRYREHDLRCVSSLDGVWDFAFLGDVDPDEIDIRSIRYDDRMAVPGCFDATPAYAGRRGLVAYRTDVLFHDGTPHRIVFDGVHHWCRVFIDGRPLRDHVGGFTRFHADIVRHEPGEAELIVLVDNRFDWERCPLHMKYYDWYHYGGISRPVEWHHLGRLWIDGIRVVTEDVAARRLALSIQYGGIEPPGPVELKIVCDGQEVHGEQVELPEAIGCLNRSIELPGVALWSPDAPNLHDLHVRLGQDDLRTRVGIRQVEVEGQQILINDQPQRLLGFCRHEAHPQFGCALPDEILVADVQQLKDLGCNFVRGSHYPQDPRFLDLCDEVGLAVWNEAIGWQHTAEHLTDPHFVNAELAHMDEMVAMSANHPSVIMWGILNESHSQIEECRPAYERLLGRLRELDPTRPVTYASNHPFDDICFDLADVISINTYPGWYVGEIDKIADNLDHIIRHLNIVGQGNKPLIISEIGAGAIPGWRDWNGARWTEQYQVKLLDAVLRHLFIDTQRTCGISLWQFCDCRSSEEGSRILRRPRGFNNKGIVDEYRRPKLAYETVKQFFDTLN
ncbi:MAG: beta-galactosidase [Anaerolineae bacterium]|nr:beta-galactosidase [Anaerolineae bacterium]